MPTASNQKLNRNQGQSKQNYSAIRYGNDKGSIAFGTLDKKATVTSGVKLDTSDGRHQLNLEIDGNRKGWTSSTSPGNFQVECGSDKEEADDTLVLNALNGNICITATNGKIRLQGTDIELVAVGEGDSGRGNITCSATETFTVHKTPMIILDSKSLTKITSTGIISIAANSCLKMYGSIIRGVTDACAKKESKTGGQRMQKESNQV
tara:strand:- start:36 stop:656 length:621 start_codon:yes stop_codon:yes gene_type:complete